MFVDAQSINQSQLQSYFKVTKQWR